ncbi:vitellogenin-A2 [Eurosta solidaginis]|uniref:vitellogenin-A2 n=1 Tax=Eurosta solidaginis TaxID=178769 RepID=UPI003531117F
MTAHEQPISYLDSILNEEESRCEYSHQWRNFTISRSGRFKSKNRKRDAVDGKLFDAGNTPNMKSSPSKSSLSSSTAITGHSRVMASATMNPHFKHQEPDKNVNRQPSAMSNKLFATQPMSSATTSSRNSTMREKTESYKSYYETNL